MVWIFRTMTINGKRWLENLGLESQTEKFRRSVQQYEYIEGPMSPITGEKKSSATPTPIADSYQLCVRRSDCANLFDRSIHSVIFLPALISNSDLLLKCHITAYFSVQNFMSKPAGIRVVKIISAFILRLSYQTMEAA